MKQLLSDEVRLFAWGDSSTSGPWIKLQLLDEAQLAPFRGLSKGEVVAAVIVLPDDTPEAAQESPTKGPHGQYAKRLKQSGFLRAPAVWKALGTDAEYLAWCKGQPCAAQGQGACQGDVVAAHVRRIADGFGTGHKAETYSAIPLCFQHHIPEQHQHGESALGGKEWFDKQRIGHVERWAWECLRDVLGVQSMTDASPEAVKEWAEVSGVHQYLPKEFADVPNHA